MCKNCSLILIVILMSACGATEKKDIAKTPEVNSRIAIVDIGEATRGDYALLIDKISKCSPRIIGVNSLFIGRKESRVDSLLAKIIRDSGKVILLAGLNSDGSVEFSDPMFTEYALGVGLNSCLKDSLGLVTEYIPLFDSFDHGQVMSFSTMLAYYYDQNRSKIIFDELKVDARRKISFESAAEDLIIINKDQLECDLIEGKIIIIDNLQISQSLLERVRRSNGEVSGMPNSLIFANIVLNILKGLDTRL